MVDYTTLVDVGVNVAVNYYTIGDLGVGGTFLKSVVGIVNQPKTIQKTAELGKTINANKTTRAYCLIRVTPVFAEDCFVAINEPAFVNKVRPYDLARKRG